LEKIWLGIMHPRTILPVCSGAIGLGTTLLKIILPGAIFNMFWNNPS
jgi:hypothetical protein